MHVDMDEVVLSRCRHLPWSWSCASSEDVCDAQPLDWLSITALAIEHLGGYVVIFYNPVVIAAWQGQRTGIQKARRLSRIGHAVTMVVAASP
mmetsp:Transcript_10649/g.15160  ORF Transcript_10649/g.15160 Transcript_10649/m.15160 type:complete len:92 (+) Transcript_10649:205-480(+)